MGGNSDLITTPCQPSHHATRGVTGGGSLLDKFGPLPPISADWLRGPEGADKTPPAPPPPVKRPPPPPGLVAMDPQKDFEPGVSHIDINTGAVDGRWVETGIANHTLTDREPFTFTVVYDDGVTLTIPLTHVFFDKQQGSTVTLVRRHRASGRVIPFQVRADDPRLRDPALAKLDPIEVFTRFAIPRFDTTLTPFLASLVNEAQILFMCVGILKVVDLNLLNPVVAGWRPAASAAGEAGAALRRVMARSTPQVAESAVQIGDRLVAEALTTNPNKFKCFLEFARRLSGTQGISAAEKAKLIVDNAPKFGLDVGGRIPRADRILVVAKDGKSAFQIASDGTITFGKFDAKAIDVVSPQIIKPPGT